MTLKQRTSSSIRLNNSYNNNLILKMSQKIRIKLKSYDHQLVDKSAEKIVKAVKATVWNGGSWCGFSLIIYS